MATNEELQAEVERLKKENNILSIHNRNMMTYIVATHEYGIDPETLQDRAEQYKKKLKNENQNG